MKKICISEIIMVIDRFFKGLDSSPDELKIVLYLLQN